MSLASEDDGIRWIKSKPKDLPEEEVLYQQGLVRVTNLVATFGADRYSIWALTLARKRRKLEESLASLFMIIMSAFVTGEAWDDGIQSAFDDGIQWPYVLLGLCVAAYALYLNERAQSSYVIQLDLAYGKVQAYTSQYEDEAAKIVDAINKAISQKNDL